MSDFSGECPLGFNKFIYPPLRNRRRVKFFGNLEKITK
nr:MAG TPA: hypothetical protein [Caudoviricetes sp.]